MKSSHSLHTEENIQWKKLFDVAFISFSFKVDKTKRQNQKQNMCHICFTCLKSSLLP